MCFNEYRNNLLSIKITKKLILQVRHTFILFFKYMQLIKKHWGRKKRYKKRLFKKYITYTIKY